MDRFAMAELRKLIEPREGPCVTICMPTHGTGENGLQDALRLKNLAQQAEYQLAEDWVRAPEARDMMDRIRTLPTIPEFWAGRSQGLGLFLEPGSLATFRVPLALEEFLHVNQRFCVRPMLPLLTSTDRFFVLALSQNQPRLFGANRYRVEQIEVPGLPSRLDEALNLDSADRGSQVHSGGRGGASGKATGVFHGQGGEPDTHKEELVQYFRLVDEALMRVLGGETAPLVLAGVGYLLPIFRRVTRYSHVVEGEATGNWDHVHVREIHAKAWLLVEPGFRHARDEARSKFQRLVGTGKASSDIREALPAAARGQVESLLVSARAHVWGMFDADRNLVEWHDAYQRGDDDLLDVAAVQTLLNRGQVYCVEPHELPTADPLAAVFRY